MTSERMSSVGLTRHAGRTEPISILDTVPLTPSIDHFPGRLAGRVGPHEAQGGKKRVRRLGIIENCLVQALCGLVPGAKDLVPVRVAPPVHRLRLRDRSKGVRRDVRALPGERVDRQVRYVRRIDAAFAERRDEGDAIAVHVVGNEVAVGGDEGAQVFAECQVDGRAVVERADADGAGSPRRSRPPRRPADPRDRAGSRLRAARRCRRWRAGTDRSSCGRRRDVKAEKTAATRREPRSCGSVVVSVVVRLRLRCRWRCATRRGCRSRRRIERRDRRVCRDRPARPRASRIAARSTAGMVKCWNSATMSAKAS